MAHRFGNHPAALGKQSVSASIRNGKLVTLASMEGTKDHQELGLFSLSWNRIDDD
ncbi:MAG: hypothetical protein WCC84_04000 [Candidatus Cybelea sp.]